MKSIRLNIIKPYDLIFMLVWISSPLLDYTRIVLDHIPLVNRIAWAIIPSIYVCLIMLSIKHFRNTIKLSDILVYGSIFTIFILNYIFFPDNVIYIKEYLSEFLIYTLPLYFIGVSMIQIKKLFPHLELLSYVVIICFFIFKNIVVNDDQTISSGGDMSGAYALLPHLLFVSWRALTRISWCKILVPILSFGILLILGNRGSLLCYTIFLLMYFFIVENKYRKPIFSIIGLAILATITYFSKVIMIGVYYFVDGIGYSTRIFDKILDEELLDLSGRDNIADILVSSIADNPFWGFGIAGDRLICDIYAHNLFLEILVSFGCVFGGMLILMLIYIMLRAYYSAHDADIKVFWLILFCSGFFPLMMSSTYLQEPKLFLFLGFSVLLAFRYKKLLSY